MEPSTVPDDSKEHERINWHDRSVYKLSMTRWRMTKVITTLRFPKLGHLELNSNQLTEVPEPPDVADALATALCHAFIGRS